MNLHLGLVKQSIAIHCTALAFKIISSVAQRMHEISNVHVVVFGELQQAFRQPSIRTLTIPHPQNFVLDFHSGDADSVILLESY